MADCWRRGGERALQFSRVPMEHLRPVTVCVCVCAFGIFWWFVPPGFLQAGRTNCCGFCLNVYLSLEPELKPMNPADAVSRPSILVWYMCIAAAASVYTVRGDKLLSPASCVCDCSLIAVHILCLWTQTELSRCTYITAKRFVSREGGREELGTSPQFSGFYVLWCSCTD